MSVLSVATAQVLPSGLKLEKILANSADLGNLAQSPTNELWLLERTSGVVRVFVSGVEKMNLTLGVNSTGQSGLLDVTFDPDYAQNGVAFVSYVDGGSHLRVGRLLRGGSSLSFNSNIIDAGVVSDFSRPGGGLQMSKDGKLLLATGDFGTSTNAQNDASLAGKLLRANLDGSTPADNPTAGSLVFAKGFRNAKAVGYNPSTARVGGTIYSNDIGNSTGQSASDELDGIKPGANYGWDGCSGSGCSGSEAPLKSWAPAALVNPEAITINRGTALGSTRVGELFFACPTNDGASKGTVEELPLSGADMDVAGTQKALFQPNNDGDGTVDTGCPSKINALAMGREGWLYTGNSGSNSAIYRIWKDEAGPREVSMPGSPFGMTIEKAGSSLKLGWENLGSLDVGRNKRFATGQRAETYELFEGNLPIVGGSYNHAAVLSTNGTAEGLARLTATLSPGSGNRYYLINAQGANLEGTLGKSSAGAARPLAAGMTADYCTTIGFDSIKGKCAPEWKNQTTSAPLILTDLNPRSPTYGQPINLMNLRGKIVKMALTSKNCFWCTVEAQDEAKEGKFYGARDFVNVSVFTMTYGYWDATPPANCATEIATWANTYATDAVIVCDPDNDGDGKGDISKKQYDHCSCAPQNYYIDKGGVIYDYVAGANFFADVSAKVTPEINPESCE